MYVSCDSLSNVTDLIQATFTDVLICIISCGVRCFQLAQAWQEVEVAKSRSQQLQDQVEDLQEKVSLQEAGSHGDVSLLSELEISLAAADVGVSKEEVRPSLLGVSLTHQSLESIYVGGFLPSCFSSSCLLIGSVLTRSGLQMQI